MLQPGMPTSSQFRSESATTGEAWRGVLPGDRQGLTNREPSFRSDAELAGDALEVSSPSSGPFRESVRFRRARHAGNKLWNSIAKDFSLTVLGNALFAADLGASADDLGPLRKA